MLDFIGTIVLVAVIALNISVFSNTIPARAATRLAVAAVAGMWTGLAAACAAAGYFANTAAPFPLIGVFVAFPLVAAGIAAIFSPAARAALLAIPTQTLVGLNIARVLGGFFLLLALVDRLGGPFPQSAGWGDVITGLFAVPVMGLAIPGLDGREWEDRAMECLRHSRPHRRRRTWGRLGEWLALAAHPCGRGFGGRAAAAMGPHSDGTGAVLPDHPWHRLRAAAGAKNRCRFGRRFELRMTPSALGGPSRRVFELSHGDGILARPLEEAVFLALGHDESIGRSLTAGEPETAGPNHRTPHPVRRRGHRPAR